MQPYRYDIKRFIIISAIIAIPANTLFGTLESVFGTSHLINIGFATSVVGLFWFLFDQYFWRLDIFRTLGVSVLPDLNGLWVGDVDRLGENMPHKFELRIFQTYSKISIQTNSENSKGHSVCAVFLTDETQKNFDLINCWSSRTKKRDHKSDNHEEFTGLSRIDIRLINGEIVLDDYYFTDRDPPTSGRMRLHRISTTGLIETNGVLDRVRRRLFGRWPLAGIATKQDRRPDQMAVKFDDGKRETLGTMPVTLDLERILSRSGAPYLGCLVDCEILQPYLRKMQSHLGEQYKVFEANRFDRDGDEYHITVVGPREYRSLTDSKKEKAHDSLGGSMEFQFVGLGCATDSNDSTYFVVTESTDAANLRKVIGLAQRDFHATLGFDNVDIHGVPKDASTLMS